ncbi:hypothetical protein IJI72_00215 [Candidatus Saccharibacteria bacterium]|nr:hypothetical protein [Candidatus Saccharibacteria bacterium]
MKKSLLLTLTLLLSVLCSPVAVFACGDGSADENGEPLDNCSEEIEGEAESSEEESIEEVPYLISGLDTSETAADETETYVAAGATVNSSRTLAHSLFLAGSSIVSNDVLDGLAFVAGNLVDYAGSSDYAFLAGNSVKISGTVERDLFVAGNSVEIDEDAMIGRDVFAAGSSVIFRSMLYGNVFMSGGRLVLENVTIDGDLNVDADEIVIKGESSIAGTFKYNDNAEITGRENLSVSLVEAYSGDSTTGKSSALSRFFSALSSCLISYLGLLAVLVVLIALAPKFMQHLLDSFRWKTSWKFLGLGLGLLIVVPLACIFALCTVIGLPLAGLTFGLYFAFICLSQGITGGILGNELSNRLLKKPKLNLFLKYALGLALIRLVSLVPVIGGLVTAVSVCFGFGYLAKRVFIRK